ncbi:hypothetical protein EV209_0637 [Cuneatibacter caecimuris]|uniref:Uncharacterized protein n=1 Tax=Cuneatibacter caecimuris TaxID=1796618 RepID=A0A4Q7PR40_9FIRM|nr:hypothetical protein EV209_0637 [Cuneatibacter caecimuris]
MPFYAQTEESVGGLCLKMIGKEFEKDETCDL